MESFIYWFKPYIFFIAGFLSGQLDHPVKWISILSFICASMLIEYWRYKSRDFDYEEIELDSSETKSIS